MIDTESADYKAGFAAGQRARRRKPGGLNRWGAIICEGCANAEHHGIYVPAGTMCHCTCTGRYDSKGALLVDKRMRIL